MDIREQVSRWRRGPAGSGHIWVRPPNWWELPGICCGSIDLALGALWLARGSPRVGLTIIVLGLSGLLNLRPYLRARRLIR